MSYKKTSIPHRLRCQVAVRDNGICQICGKIGELKIYNPGYMAFEKQHAWSNASGSGVSSGVYKGYISFEIDHIFPESLGGKLSIENLQLVCRSCNRRKATKHGKTKNNKS